MTNSAAYSSFNHLLGSNIFYFDRHTFSIPTKVLSYLSLFSNVVEIQADDNRAKDAVMKKSAEITGGTFSGDPEAGVTDLYFHVAYIIQGRDLSESSKYLPPSHTNLGFASDKNAEMVEAGYGYIYCDLNKKLLLRRIANQLSIEQPSFSTPEKYPAFYTPEDYGGEKLVPMAIPNVSQQFRESNKPYPQLANKLGKTGRIGVMDRPADVTFFVPARVLNTRHRKPIINALLR